MSSALAPPPRRLRLRKLTTSRSFLSHFPKNRISDSTVPGLCFGSRCRFRIWRDSSSSYRMSIVALCEGLNPMTISLRAQVSMAL